jgi:adenosylcobinamide-GDP ribazoletransferase
MAKTVQWTEKRTARSLFVLPWIGILLGLMFYSFLQLLQYLPISTIVGSILALLLPLVLTGGLHLDGWMDVSDAYFSHQSKEKKLRILSDPHVGSFAILSLIVLLLLRFSAIYELASLPSLSIWTCVIVFTLPRIGAAFLLMRDKPAKDTGLAAYFQKGVTKQSIYAFTIMSLFLVATFIVFIDNKFIILFFACFLWLWIRFYRSQFGGVTGDVIGATIEGGETFLWITLWLSHVFVTV